MNRPRPNLCKQIAFLALGLFLQVVQGQELNVYPLAAWIKIPSNADAFQVKIYDTSDEGTATMSLPGQSQRRLVNIDVIEKISFTYPPAVLEALTAVEQRDYSAAEAALRAYSDAILPFGIIPENNILRIVDSYEHSLHQRNETSLLRDLYTQLSQLDVEDLSLEAEIWLAYLDAREGKLEASLSTFSDPSIRQSSGVSFFLQQLAFCRKEMSDKAYRTAIDHSARVIAAGTIEDALYPEALYLSAQCYDGLAEAEQARLETERQEAIQRELLVERVRVALDLEAKADQAGAPPPTEQEILEAVDQRAVEARVPPVPSVKENPFALIAQQLYVFNEQVFPSTYWGGKASARVWAETRDTKQNDLTNFTPSDERK